ncbi:MAG: methyltransferase domain-containing protein, partial [Candidatus Omnitrophica bacterium]|nr:methyltransferase domain-containing protein [Candidatus Omnitrophota bacterium]
MSVVNGYHRVEFNGTPVYVNGDIPDWFIPAPKADMLLREVSGDERSYGSDHGSLSDRIDLKMLLTRLREVPSEGYRGRAEYRKLTGLKECWLHITNRCNMACGHCMFASDDGCRDTLKKEALVKAVREANDLGCRLFYFTGGEPFMYEGFTGVCDEVLAEKDNHIVILTNGRDLSRQSKWLDRAPRERVHFQLSADGMKENHERVRGEGSFSELNRTIEHIRGSGFPLSLAMSVNSGNLGDMPAVVEHAASRGIDSVHFLWLFKKGKAGRDLFADPGCIFEQLRTAYEKGQDLGVDIDNCEMLKSRIFSFPGTRFDLTNAGWESLAVGPDGNIYPSPATVYEKDLLAGNISDGIENVWRNSPVLRTVREASIVSVPGAGKDPLRYLTGGGDMDHSYIHAGDITGGSDPYIELYNRTALYLLWREAREYVSSSPEGLLCRMGEKVYDCGGDTEAVRFTHSNCVLSLPGRHGHSLVKGFYSRAAEDVNEDIVNPVHYDETEISHIPEHARVRSYGCGSPVLDAGLEPGEVMVDLGSGTGVECLIAAAKVGMGGKIYGVDMSGPMLERARTAAEESAGRLGYSNVEFLEGYLESIPLGPGEVDAVISNCVINLSPDKRRTFSEVSRILRPGGRMVISDIVSEREIPVDIKYNEKLRGECIGGAMTENELFGLIGDLGFTGVYVNKRFLYRKVAGYEFYSVTYTARKKKKTGRKKIIYRGALPAVLDMTGGLVPVGRTAEIDTPPVELPPASFFVLDDDGNVINMDEEMSCSCFNASRPESSQRPDSGGKHSSGCLVCGHLIIYPGSRSEKECYYCGKRFPASSVCEEGHFVCDNCHAAGSRDLITSMALRSRERDMIRLFAEIRKSPLIPVHGPEHHSL